MLLTHYYIVPLQHCFRSPIPSVFAPLASLIHKRSTLRTHDPLPHCPLTSGAYLINWASCYSKSAISNAPGQRLALHPSTIPVSPCRLVVVLSSTRRCLLLSFGRSLPSSTAARNTAISGAPSDFLVSGICYLYRCPVTTIVFTLA